MLLNDARGLRGGGSAATHDRRGEGQKAGRGEGECARFGNDAAAAAQRAGQPVERGDLVGR